MMKQYFSLALSVLLCGAAAAQSPQVLKKLRSKYDVVFPHVDDGIILVNKGGQSTTRPERAGGKFGYVDTLGQVIVPPSYEHGVRFHNGFAIIGRTDKQGAIDRTGRVVVPIAWDRLSNFESGVAVAVDKSSGQRRYSLIDTMGRVRPLEYDYCGHGVANGFAVVGIGKYEVDDTPSPMGLTRSEPSMRFVGKYGYITPNGELAVPVQYDEARDFGEDWLAPVGMQGKYYVKWGLIDATGAAVVPCDYFSIDHFHYGLALVSKIVSGGKQAYGYLDRSGKEAIACQFDEATRFEFANTWVGMIENGETRYSLIDRTGKPVLDYPVYRLQDGGKYGHAVAAIADEAGVLRYGIVGISGKIILPFEFDSITIFSDLDPETLEQREAAIATRGQERFSLDISKRKR